MRPRFLGPSANTGCAAGGPTSSSSCLIDFVLANATAPATAKSGYYFAMGVTAVGGVNLSYTIGSAPASFNQTGVRGFCSNEDGVIRFNASVTTPISTNAACVAYMNLP